MAMGILPLVLETMADLGISRNQLAKRADVSRVQVGRWLTGRANPTQETLFRMFDVLGLKLVRDTEVEAPVRYSGGWTLEKLTALGQRCAREVATVGWNDAGYQAAIWTHLAPTGVKHRGVEYQAALAAGDNWRAEQPAPAVATAARAAAAPPAAPVSPPPAAYASGWTLAELQEWGAGVAQQAIADGEDVAAAVRQSLTAADLAADGPEAAAVLAAALAAQGGE